MQQADTSSTLAWYPQATADVLPPMMLETDPRLSCQHLEDHLPSIMTTDGHGPVYRYSHTLVYKPVCRKRETMFVLRAGDLTLPVVSKVGIVDDVSSMWYQKGAIMRLGHPLSLTRIPPSEKPAIARQMMDLVARLHEKGVIHGDIRLDKFVTRPEDGCLRLVGFSVARMEDDSDLSSWLLAIPSPEYTSPSRRSSRRPSSFSDDQFALAVSIWAIFAGEMPTADLFSSNEAHMPDLSKITDHGLFCAVVELLEEGGLKVDRTSASSQKSTLGIERTVSFPLSLFGPDPDDADELAAVKPRPHFCPHCLEIALSTNGEAIGTEPYRPSRYHVASLNDYALEWLRGQEPLKLQCDHGPVCTRSNQEHLPRTSAKKPELRINTSTQPLNIESPAWSAMSTATSGPATVIAGDHTRASRRRSTVVRSTMSVTRSETDEGYESTKQTSNAASRSETKSGSVGMQRTMSHWSESSVESHAASDEVESDVEV